MSWTDERVERLKDLRGQNLSASQIAMDLGGVSRNAVIGKLHRIGMTTLVVTQRHPKKQKAHPGRVNNPFGRNARTKDKADRQAPTLVPEVSFLDLGIPASQRIASLLDLSEGCCRWPVGNPEDPDFFFCGGTSLKDKPYCSHHSRVAYQPLQRKPSVWRV